VVPEPHLQIRSNSDAIVAQSILLFLLVRPANRSTPAPGASSAASVFLFQIDLKQASAGRVRALFLPRSGTQTALAAAAGVDVKFTHWTLLSVRWLSA
jgi:hypothetical protein